jgi:hypothetical protein
MSPRIFQYIGVTQISWRSEGDEKQVSYSGPKIIRLHSTKFSRADDLWAWICA